MRRSDSLAWPGEALRREERRAEARLAEGLQRLEEVKHYHLNTLTREQRKLHRDLISIRTGNYWRKGIPNTQPTNLDLSHPAVPYRRTLLPIIPRPDREPQRQASIKPQSSTSLQNRVQEFISSGSKTDSSTVPLCLPDLKLQPVHTLPSTSTATAGREEKKDRMTKESEVEVSPPASLLSDYLAPDGRLRTVHTLPNFAQALVEARKARYIRHRGQPLCESGLTITEIFSRHSKDAQTH
ncbi:coiled-coil domain-containing protein 190 [Chanos chanos]|uniref:Coiled-coil domain-containing protein 190 n=1 Tax=Chanos chanos TaxID=29144 RepID=A0A6J2V8A1_CHACN|nr:coiled-coil domain-containing protein 190-like [Chanos chanos]